MYISEIKIKNFKKLEDVKIAFNHGINVIKGANEQGKSTLLKAIIAALYADPSSLKARESFKSWNKDEYPSLELDFFIGENLYSITKDFNTKEAVFRDVLNQTEEKTLTGITNRVKEAIGVANENLLRATACVQHDELSAIESGKKNLNQAIQDISLNGEKTDVLELIRGLQTKIDEMQVGLYHPAKNNGIIKKLKDEIGERSGELEKIKGKVDQVENATEKLKSLQKELKDVETEIAKYTKIVEDYEKYESVRKDLDALQEKIKTTTLDLEKIKDLKGKIEIALNKLNELGGTDILNTLDEKQKDLITLNAQIQSIEKELTELKPKEAEPVEIETKTSFGTISLLFSVISLICVIVGIFTYHILIFIGLIMVSLNLIFTFFIKEDKQKANKGDDPEKLRQMQLQGEREDLNAQRDAILGTCFVSTPEEFFAKRTQLIALNADYIQMNATIEALLRGQQYDAIESTLQNDIVKKKELEADLPETEPVKKEEYLRDKRELELLNLDKKDITEEITQEKANINAQDITPEDEEEKEKKLQSLQEELEQHEQHLLVLQSICTALTQAKDDISSHIGTNIENYVQKSLPAITNGRYESLRIGKDFTVQVFSKEKNDWINPSDHLSKGTIDEIYLSARLAIADILTQGKPVPLFFDDPFLAFDEKRRNALMEELKTIAQTHQTFIFTCHDFFDGYGSVVTIAEE